MLLYKGSGPSGWGSCFQVWAREDMPIVQGLGKTCGYQIIWWWIDQSVFPDILRSYFAKIIRQLMTWEQRSALLNISSVSINWVIFLFLSSYCPSERDWNWRCSCISTYVVCTSWIYVIGLSMDKRPYGCWWLYDIHCLCL